MQNKVLVKMIVPTLDENFDLFIPVNELIWKIKRLAAKAISDLSNTPLKGTDFILLNKETGRCYDNNELVINTDIRNSSELLLLIQK